MPLVSIILPCYNSHATIKEAIDSIINQTFADWELTVVDDASTDDSIKIIENINDPRIKIIRQKVNGGYPVGMNAGLSLATGEYIARMDADDICLPNRLEVQLKTLEENQKASLCGTNRFRITPGGKMYIDKGEHTGGLKWESWEDLMRGSRIFTDASVILKRERVLAVGGYRTYQRSGMDVDLWLRVMEKFGPAITLLEPLYGRTINSGSLIFNPDTYLINQIPRVLARQRIERGSDDVQNGAGVNIQEYKRLGFLKEDKAQDNAGLFLGSIVTCLWLGDWTGARIYYRHLRCASDLSLPKIIFKILIKIVQRNRSNPYTRYNPVV